MQKIMNWFTRKRIASLSLLGSICFALLIPKKVSNFIYETLGSSYVNIFDHVLVLLILAIGVLAVVPFLFTTDEKVFIGWRRTLFVYTFIYIFIMSVTPIYSGDEYIHITIGVVAIFFSAVYAIFSWAYLLFKSR